MNKNVVAIIVIVLAAAALWYGYGKMKPYMATGGDDGDVGVEETTVPI